MPKIENRQCDQEIDPEPIHNEDNNSHQLKSNSLEKKMKPQEFEIDNKEDTVDANNIDIGFSSHINNIEEKNEIRLTEKKVTLDWKKSHESIKCNNRQDSQNQIKNPFMKSQTKTKGILKMISANKDNLKFIDKLSDKTKELEKTKIEVENYYRFLEKLLRYRDYSKPFSKSDLKQLYKIMGMEVLEKRLLLVKSKSQLKKTESRIYLSETFPISINHLRPIFNQISRTSLSFQPFHSYFNRNYNFFAKNYPTKIALNIYEKYWARLTLTKFNDKINKHNFLESFGLVMKNHHANRDNISIMVNKYGNVNSIPVLNEFIKVKNVNRGDSIPNNVPEQMQFYYKNRNDLSHSDINHKMSKSVISGDLNIKLDKDNRLVDRVSCRGSNLNSSYVNELDKSNGSMIVCRNQYSSKISGVSSKFIRNGSANLENGQLINKKFDRKGSLKEMDHILEQMNDLGNVELNSSKKISTESIKNDKLNKSHDVIYKSTVNSVFIRKPNTRKTIAQINNISTKTDEHNRNTRKKVSFNDFLQMSYYKQQNEKILKTDMKISNVSFKKIGDEKEGQPADNSQIGFCAINGPSKIASDKLINQNLVNSHVSEVIIMNNDENINEKSFDDEIRNSDTRKIPIFNKNDMHNVSNIHNANNISNMRKCSSYDSNIDGYNHISKDKMNLIKNINNLKREHFLQAGLFMKYNKDFEEQMKLLNQDNSIDQEQSQLVHKPPVVVNVENSHDRKSSNNQDKEFGDYEINTIGSVYQVMNNPNQNSSKSKQIHNINSNHVKPVYVKDYNKKIDINKMDHNLIEIANSHSKLVQDLQIMNNMKNPKPNDYYGSKKNMLSSSMDNKYVEGNFNFNSNSQVNPNNNTIKTLTTTKNGPDNLSNSNDYDLKISDEIKKAQIILEYNQKQKSLSLLNSDPEIMIVGDLTIEENLNNSSNMNIKRNPFEAFLSEDEKLEILDDINIQNFEGDFENLDLEEYTKQNYYFDKLMEYECEEIKEAKNSHK